MRPYTYKIAAGEQLSLEVAGTMAVMIDSSAVLDVEFQRPNGGKDIAPMFAGDAISEIDFHRVLFKNKNQATVIFTVLLGKEKFERKVAQIAGVVPVPQIYQPKEMQLLTAATETLVGGDIYYNRIVVPANQLRKKLHVRVTDAGLASGGEALHENQTLQCGYTEYNKVWNEPNNDPYPSGFPLNMGEGRTIENSGEIQLCASYPITGAQIMAVFLDEEF